MRQSSGNVGSGTMILFKKHWHQDG